MIVERLRYFEAHFQIADETAAVTEQLRRLITEVPVGGKQVHDANIVATMLAYDIPALLTHNTRDFERFAKWIRAESIG